MGKAWQIVCLLFCFYSIAILIKELQEVTYQLEDDNSTVFNYLGCVDLRSVLFDHNQTEIRLEQLKSRLLDYFARWKVGLDGQDLDYFEEMVLEPVQSGAHLIWRGLACLPAEDRDELDDLRRLLNLRTMFAFDSGSFDLFKLRQVYQDELDQIIVLNEEAPYSGCDKRNSRFRCLNECFRAKARLSRYFYYGYETGLIQLNEPTRNQSIEANERSCFERCQREDYRITSFLPSGNFDPKHIIYKALPAIRRKDFCIQMVSLICLFSNTSIAILLSRLVDFIRIRASCRGPSPKIPLRNPLKFPYEGRVGDPYFEKGEPYFLGEKIPL